MRHFAAAAAMLGLAMALPAAAATVIDGVTIVDTATGHLQPGRAILIDGGRIVRIARAGTIKTGGSTARIDASGKFVVPGYLDMHAHPLNSGGPERSLPLMVANGITGYRQMAGSDALLAQRRQGTLPVPAVAPELLALPGMVLAGPLARDPAATAAEVRRQIAAGADLIKIIDLGPPAFFAALAAANDAHVATSGHLPPTVDVREAAAKGMKSIEHLGPQISLLEACSSDEAAIRAAAASAPPRGGGINFAMPLADVKRMVANPMVASDPATFRTIQHVLDTYDDARCRALAKTLAASTMWQVPTLIRVRTMEFGDDPAYRDDPNLRYAPADDRALWADVGQRFAARMTPQNRATLAALFDRQLKLVKLFDDAGVKMLAGTDFGGQWIVAGFSLHQEFDLLAQAGLSPLRVLQMTTRDGARFLGREATMGSVAAGKDANLVVLDANPVAAVANLHRIDAVVRGGHYYSRADLDAIERTAALP